MVEAVLIDLPFLTQSANHLTIARQLEYTNKVRAQRIRSASNRVQRRPACSIRIAPNR